MNSGLFRAAVAAAIVLIAGCTSSAATSQPQAAPFAPSAQPSATAPPASTQSAASHVPTGQKNWPAGWTLPDRNLSPGAVQPGYTIRDICPHVNPALEAMRPTAAEKNKVYAAYGITHHVSGQYEVDHIIPVELLGLVGAPAGDPAENLYPEPNVAPDPVMMARYHLDPAYVENPKDILEDRLHQLVCAGTVPLTTAQHAIATDWRAAYVRYVGNPPA